MIRNPRWLAPRHGQDWRDEETLKAIDWLTSTIPAKAWEKRIDAVRTHFEAARAEWAEAKPVALFDPADTVAWYIFQSQAYAANRVDWFEPEGFRLAPLFRRLGQLVDDLKSVEGAEARAAALMTHGRKQPDDGLYEFLVAGAYKHRGWTRVAFVPEQPGVAKTQDLLVERPRRKWAVECKRVNRSGYEFEERQRGEALAKPVHDRCRELNRSVTMAVRFDEELAKVPDGYLLERLETYLRTGRGYFKDPQAEVGIDPVDWSLAQTALAVDDIYYGSSRMIELLAGFYVDDADHSVLAKWTPAKGRPLYATAVSQASVVSWTSESMAASMRKAKHFRSLVAQAAKQLPPDVPGVVHVGYEARDGNAANGLRHYLNRVEMKTFSPGATRLRWVYANYMTPERTTARMESAALTETTAAYKIGQHSTQEPLHHHLLFDDEGGIPGSHLTR